MADFPTLGVMFDLDALERGRASLRGARDEAKQLGGATTEATSKTEALSAEMRLAGEAADFMAKKRRAAADAAGKAEDLARREMMTTLATAQQIAAFRSRMADQEQRQAAATAAADDRAYKQSQAAAQQLMAFRSRMASQRNSEAAQEASAAAKIQAAVEKQAAAEEAAFQRATFSSAQIMTARGRLASAAQAEAAATQAAADKQAAAAAKVQAAEEAQFQRALFTTTQITQARQRMAAYVQQGAAQQSAATKRAVDEEAASYDRLGAVFATVAQRGARAQETEAAASVRVAQAASQQAAQSERTRANIQAEIAVIGREITALTALADAKANSARVAAVRGGLSGAAIDTVGEAAAVGVNTQIAQATARQRDLEAQLTKTTGGWFGQLRAMLSFGHGVDSQKGAVGGLLGVFGSMFEGLGRLRVAFLNARFALALFFGAITLAPLIAAMDTMTGLESRIRAFSKTAGDVPVVMGGLYAAAQDARAPLTAVSQLYARLAPLADQLGRSEASLIGIVTDVSKAFTIGGASASEAASSAIQFAQALSSNRFGGDELRSVAENAPVLLQVIAEGVNKVNPALNLNAATFIKWAQAGNANSKIIIEAMEASHDKIQQLFAQFPMTIGQALTVTGNAWLNFIATLNKQTGLSTAIANLILQFRDLLDSKKTLDTVAGAVTGFMDAMRAVPGILNAVRSAIGPLIGALASLLIIRTLTAIVPALTIALSVLQTVMSGGIAGAGAAALAMQRLQAAFAPATAGARALIAALGGLGAIGVAAAVMGVVYAVQAMAAAQKEAQAATQQYREVQDGAIGALQHAAEFAKTYQINQEGVTAALNAATGAAVQNTSQQDVATRAAMARAEAERTLTVNILRRAAADATSRAAEQQRSVTGLFGTENQAGIAGVNAGLNRFFGQNADAARYTQEQSRLKGISSSALEAANSERQLATSLIQQANAMQNAKLTLPKIDGGNGNGTMPPAKVKPDGLDGARNSIAKLWAEVKGLNEQIDAIYQAPLDPLADMSARIKAAGDEAAARYTAGKAAEAGFAGQARAAAAAKEEASIRLELVKALRQEALAANDAAQSARVTAAIQERGTQAMLAYYDGADSSINGYVSALKKQDQATLDAELAAKQLEIAQRYGVTTIPQIADAYQKATGATREHAMQVQEVARQDFNAAAASIELQHQLAAQQKLEASLVEMAAQTKDANDHTAAIRAGTAALADYNVKLAETQALQKAGVGAWKGIPYANPTRQVTGAADAQLVANERMETAQLAEQARLAGLTTQEREAEVRAGAMLQAQIAQANIDGKSLTDSEKARLLTEDKITASIEQQHLAFQTMIGQAKDAARQTFIDTGSLTQLGKSLHDSFAKAIRAAIYDELIAKPINIIINAVFSKIGGLTNILSGLAGSTDPKALDALHKMQQGIQGLLQKTGQSVDDAEKNSAAIVNGLGAVTQAIGDDLAGKAIVQALGIRSKNDSGGSAITDVIAFNAAAVANAFLPGTGTIVSAIVHAIGGLFGPGVTPDALAQIGLVNGRFAVTGGQSDDDKNGELLASIKQAGGSIADSLNSIFTGLGVDMSKLSGLSTTFGYITGDQTKMLGTGYYGGTPTGVDGGDPRGELWAAREHGLAVHGVTDATEAANEVIINLLQQAIDHGALNLSGAEKALIESAQDVSAAVQTIVAARSVVTNLNNALLKYTNPKQAALNDLATQQEARRSQIQDYINQGLITADQIPGIEATLQALEGHEVSDALSQVAAAAGEAAASLEDIKSAQKDIADYVRNLKVGALSPLSPADQLAQAQQNYQTMLTAAQGGDYNALKGITDASDKYLSLAQSFYGGTGSYAAIFQQVSDSLSALSTQDIETPWQSEVTDQLQAILDAVGGGLHEVVGAITGTDPGTDPGGGGGIGGGGLGGGLPFLQMFAQQMISQQQQAAALAAIEQNTEDTAKATQASGEAIVGAQQMSSEAIAKALSQGTSFSDALRGGTVPV